MLEKEITSKVTNDEIIDFDQSPINHKSSEKKIEECINRVIL